MATKYPRKREVARLVTENRQPCVFCDQDVDDEVIYGKLYALGDIQCHYFCVLLSCCLVQKGGDSEGLFGFLYKDIVAEVERSKKHRCSYCGRGGASLGCSVAACRKQFHLPCGRRKNAVSLFYGNYKSFCELHAPKQKISDAVMAKAKERIKKDKLIRAGKIPISKSEETKQTESQDDPALLCVICYEDVKAYPTTQTFWPPCCGRDAWLHRSCLQRMALSAGMHYLKCPLCNDKEHFYDAVCEQGYYLPDRDAAWELEQNAFAEIYNRDAECAAPDCKCPFGRSHDELGTWDIKLCLLCGSWGMHAACSGGERAVCPSCSPAAADIEQLETRLAAVIMAEQAREQQRARSGPVMPARMSLRRTKGRMQLHSASSSSQTMHSHETPENKTESARLELNLKSPRVKLARPALEELEARLLGPASLEGLQARLLGPASLEGLQARQLGPASLEGLQARQLGPASLEGLQARQLGPASLEGLQARQLGPASLEGLQARQLGPASLEGLQARLLGPASLEGLQARLMSPAKLLEQTYLQHGGARDVLVSSDLLHKIRAKFSKPKPLCAKKKILYEILDDLFKNVYKENPKSKEPIKEWNSPRKSCDITNDNEKNMESAQNTNDTKVADNPEQDLNDSKYTQKVEEHGNQDMSKENSNIDDKSSDKENEPNELDDDKCDAKSDDDSSRSTFELPPEFIAESEDSILETPKKLRMVDMKQSSIEISENNEVLNIDVMHIGSGEEKEFIKNLTINSPTKNKILFQFSPREKEPLQTSNVEMDVESFKDQYLSEVDRDKANFKVKKRKLDMNDGVGRKRKKDEKKMRKKLKIKIKSKNKSNRGKKIKKVKTLQIQDKNVRIKIRLKEDKTGKKIKLSHGRTKKQLNVAKTNKIKEGKTKRIQLNEGKSKQIVKSLKQYVLKYSPLKTNQVLAKPEVDITPMKRKYTKLDISPDNLVQTSIQSFFKAK